MSRHTSDLMLCTGVAWLTFGAWSVYPPAGYLILGALLLAGGLARGRADALKGRKS